jgi:hypothetical protein
MRPNQATVAGLASPPVVPNYVANTALRVCVHRTKTESRGVVLLHPLHHRPILSIELAVQASPVHTFQRVRHPLSRQMVGIACKEGRVPQRRDQAARASLPARIRHILLTVHRPSRHLVRAILRYLAQ